MSAKEIILDCDIGTDDALALLLALGFNADLSAATTVGGNCSLAQATDNACYLLELSCREDIPVFAGEDIPIKAEVKKIITDAGAVAHGKDGLQGQSRTPREKSPERQSAVDFILQTLRKAEKDQVTIVATGPLTNIASAIRQDEGLFAKLCELVVMGGAIRESGNVTPSAEFNFYADPESANEVLQAARTAAIPLTLVPLDATHQVCLSETDLLQKIGGGSSIKDFVCRLTQPYITFYASVGFTWGCPLHDPLAMGIALCSCFAVEQERLNIAVETHGKYRGMTVADLRPTDVETWRDKAERWRHHRDTENLNATVITKVDERGFKEALIEAIRCL